MGDFKDKHGKTRVGKILQKIGGVIPGVLDVAGDLTGVEILNKASDALQGVESATRAQLIDELTLALQYEGMLIEDKQDARDMQKEALKQGDLFSKRFTYYLAAFFSIVWAVMLFFLLFKEIPESNIRLFDVCLGIQLGIITSIMGFFFGSSAGSKNKTSELIKSIKG